MAIIPAQDQTKLTGPALTTFSLVPRQTHDVTPRASRCKFPIMREGVSRSLCGPPWTDCTLAPRRAPQSHIIHPTRPGDPLKAGVETGDIT